MLENGPKNGETSFLHLVFASLRLVASNQRWSIITVSSDQTDSENPTTKMSYVVVFMRGRNIIEGLLSCMRQYTSSIRKKLN